MADLARDLISIRRLIKEWNHICKTGNMAKKMKFVYVDVGKLKDLDLKLKNHDTLINSILQKLQSATGDAIYAQTAKLQQQSADMVKAFHQQHEEVMKAFKKIEGQTTKREKWEEVVNQHGIEAVSQAARGQDDRPWLLIKEDLVKKGLSKEEAENLLNPIRLGLNDLQASGPVSVSPHPKVTADTTSSPVVIPIHPKTPIKVKQPDLAPSSPLPEGNPLANPSQDSVLIRATAKSKAQAIELNRSRILFADESNIREFYLAFVFISNSF